MKKLNDKDPIADLFKRKEKFEKHEIEVAEIEIKKLQATPYNGDLSLRERWLVDGGALVRRLYMGRKDMRVVSPEKYDELSRLWSAVTSKQAKEEMVAGLKYEDWAKQH